MKARWNDRFVPARVTSTALAAMLDGRAIVRVQRRTYSFWTAADIGDRRGVTNYSRDLFERQFERGIWYASGGGDLAPPLFFELGKFIHGVGIVVIRELRGKQHYTFPDHEVRKIVGPRPPIPAAIVQAQRKAVQSGVVGQIVGIPIITTPRNLDAWFLGFTRLFRHLDPFGALGRVLRRGPA